LVCSLGCMTDTPTGIIYKLHMIYIYLLMKIDTLLLRPSLHFTASHLNFTALLDDICHTSVRFTSPIYFAFLTFFLRIIGLQGKVPNASAGSWFQFLVVLFTKEYFLIFVICFVFQFSEHDQPYSNS